MALVEEAYQPLQRAGVAMLAGYSEAELAAFRRILLDSIKVQERATEELARGQ